MFVYVRAGRPQVISQSLDGTPEGHLAQANTGTCELCKYQASKSQMTRHLMSCAATYNARGASTVLVQLRIEAAGDPRYWLYVEAQTGATLQQLDAFLRRVWLECCGHMSAFRVGQREVAKRSAIGQVFGRKGLRFTYDYDFGSTTSLGGQVLGERQGSVGRAALRLLARNDPLPWPCEMCTRPATVVCPFCIDAGPWLFCQEHAQEHPCAKEEVYLPVVNSPRMGVCAYGA